MQQFQCAMRKIQASPESSAMERRTDSVSRTSQMHNLLDHVEPRCQRGRQHLENRQRYFSRTAATTK